jgi:hypothetical protein
VYREMREKKKRRFISRSIMEDLKEQYMDTPEELSHKVGYLSDFRSLLRTETF